MAHTMLFTLGYNAPEDRILPENFDWDDQAIDLRRRIEDGERPAAVDHSISMWRRTMATVKGSGSHDKTGRHCLPDDPNGKLDIVRDAGAWMRDDDGTVTKRASEHICWDGCMFPNDVMLTQQTWNEDSARR